MEDLCFLGALEYNDEEDSYIAKLQVMWIKDPTMFFVELDNDDLEHVYFWSLLGFRLFATDIKVNGDTLINGKRYTVKNFPIVQIKFTHEVFEKKIGEEKVKQIKEDIETWEKEVFKEYINQSHSN